MSDVWIEFTSAEEQQPVKLHGLWLPQQARRRTACCSTCTARAGTCARPRTACSACTNSALRCSASTTAASARAPTRCRAKTWRMKTPWPPGTGWRKQQPQAKRFVFGHSLGSAIAVRLASEVDDITGVIVEGGFTSIPDVFSTMKWGWLPLGPLITQRFDAASRLDKLKAPLLVVHGANDNLIKPDLGRALYERARQPKRFVLVEGGTHHNTNAVGQVQLLFGRPWPEFVRHAGRHAWLDGQWPRLAHRLAFAAAACCALAAHGERLSGCAIVDSQQRHWIFQPGQRTWAAGAQAAEGMSEVWIEFASAEEKQPVKLHGLWLPQADAGAPVMLYLHGARWDVGSSAPRMRAHARAGFFGARHRLPRLRQEHRGPALGRPDARRRARRLAMAGAAAAAGPALPVRPLARCVDRGARWPARPALPPASSSKAASPRRSTWSTRTWWRWLPLERLITQRLDAGVAHRQDQRAAAGRACRPGHDGPARPRPRAVRARQTHPSASCSSTASCIMTSSPRSTRSTGKPLPTCSV